jgi:hypothetical protein
MRMTLSLKGEKSPCFHLKTANCQDKKDQRDWSFYLSPVFVTLARNLGAFAKISDDSG